MLRKTAVAARSGAPARALRPSRPRRTQEERRAGTQAALLDAAVACLREQGYAGLTTTMVADRAGVSRGAQLHHYPTRAELVAAAVAHVFAGLTEAFEKAFAGASQGERSAALAARVLWSVYLEPAHEAVLDLYTAARTDAELRDSLVPVAERHRANVLALAVRYFPESAGDPGFRLTLELLLSAMLGMAVARCLYGDDAFDPALPALLERLAGEAAGETAAKRRATADTSADKPGTAAKRARGKGAR